MFKRKNAVVAFLVIAVLLLGIGYAAVTDNLQITAVAAASNEDLGADFDTALGFGKYEVGAASNADVEITNGNPDISETNLLDEVTFTANFSQKGQTAVVVYTIYNKHEDLTATLANPTVKFGSSDTDAGTYFKVNSVALESQSVAAGGNTTVTVTIEMIRTPAEARTETFTIGIVATAAES